MTVITATFCYQTRSFGDHLEKLGKRQREVKIGCGRSAVSQTPHQELSYTLEALDRHLAALEHQQAWTPPGSRPQFNRREKSGEREGLVPSDRGIHSRICAGTQPSPQPNLGLSFLVFGPYQVLFPFLVFTQYSLQACTLPTCSLGYTTLPSVSV